MFPRHPSEFFRYRVLVEILAASTVFISTTLALSQQIFVFSLLGC